MHILCLGYGMGTKAFAERPGCVRTMFGEADESRKTAIMRAFKANIGVSKHKRRGKGRIVYGKKEKAVFAFSSNK